MEVSTSVHKMMRGNKIRVPDYQRAYSWTTPGKDEKNITQIDVFLSDLEAHCESGTSSPYYFGHFLFEVKKKNDDIYYVIDGQQRLTTIVIFLSALFLRLRQIRPLTEKEEIIFEDMIKRKSAVHFSTDGYDDIFFKAYVINQRMEATHKFETESSYRIAKAFDYFKEALLKKTEDEIRQLLRVVKDATCSTHPVEDESEAIQMFIFQNNRGKKPSNLEIVKAQFMFVAHLQGGEEADTIVSEIKGRFEEIYKSISAIEYNITEDEVLLHSLRVYFNSLRERNALEKIDKCLSGEDPIGFIKNFTWTLSNSFTFLSLFFGRDQRKNFAIHSLIALNGIGVGLPFIIKAYSYEISETELERLCGALESLVLRHRLVGTRAELISRVNDVFKDFTKNNSSIDPILKRVEKLRTAKDWWWAFWNDEKLEASLQGGIHHPLAKYLLWKYEGWLEGRGKNGYHHCRFDEINRPELEHIAPSTEPSLKPHGYDEYDEEFKNESLNCLGNYLLLSKSHNCAVGNKSFKEKIETYKHNEQQREVRELGLEFGTWTRDLIQERKKRIIDAVLNQKNFS